MFKVNNKDTSTTLGTSISEKRLVSGNTAGIPNKHIGSTRFRPMSYFLPPENFRKPLV